MLRSAFVAGSRTTVSGSLESSAGTAFRVELFSNAECDVYGFGEGASFVGSAVVVTDAGGAASFTVDLDVALDPGSSVTATASGDRSSPR